MANYDQSGGLLPRATMAVNRTGRAELVLTAEQLKALRGGSR